MEKKMETTFMDYVGFRFRVQGLGFRVETLLPKPAIISQGPEL